MMRIPFRIVDVFTDRPLAGNQLCVVPEPLDVPADVMLAVAREIGFSETTFVTQAGGDRYSMRIFTPGHELPFAGHPTLGTAFVLVSEGSVTTPATQTVAAGDFRVDVDVAGGTARMRQHAPEFGQTLDAEGRNALASACRLSADDVITDLPVQYVSTGLGYLNMPVRDVETLVRARPDRASLSPLLEAAGTDAVYLFVVLDDAGAGGGSRARARLFAPPAGIEEDAATGSAAGPLGAYLVHHGVIPSGRLTIFQGEEIGRPSTLEVDIEPDGGSLIVHVSGGVRVVAHGAFDLPV
jgi:trans-2,3-dihydro-3-hydroxyanthranilate isomerase